MPQKAGNAEEREGDNNTKTPLAVWNTPRPQPTSYQWLTNQKVVEVLQAKICCGKPAKAGNKNMFCLN